MGMYSSGKKYLETFIVNVSLPIFFPFKNGDIDWHITFR
jgi:hypothetical protein